MVLTAGAEAVRNLDEYMRHAPPAPHGGRRGCLELRHTREAFTAAPPQPSRNPPRTPAMREASTAGSARSETAGPLASVLDSP